MKYGHAETARRRKRPEKVYEWERSVRAKEVSFQVERLSGRLRMAEWMPARYTKGRGSFRYFLSNK